jgi:hypothetical protein
VQDAVDNMLRESSEVKKAVVAAFYQITESEQNHQCLYNYTMKVRM